MQTGTSAEQDGACANAKCGASEVRGESWDGRQASKVARGSCRQVGPDATPNSAAKQQHPLFTAKVQTQQHAAHHALHDRQLVQRHAAPPLKLLRKRTRPCLQHWLCSCPEGHTHQAGRSGRLCCCCCAAARVAAGGCCCGREDGWAATGQHNIQPRERRGLQAGRAVVTCKLTRCIPLSNAMQTNSTSRPQSSSSSSSSSSTCPQQPTSSSSSTCPQQPNPLAALKGCNAPHPSPHSHAPPAQASRALGTPCPCCRGSLGSRQSSRVASPPAYHNGTSDVGLVARARPRGASSLAAGRAGKAAAAGPRRQGTRYSAYLELGSAPCLLVLVHLQEWRGGRAHTLIRSQGWASRQRHAGQQHGCESRCIRHRAGAAPTCARALRFSRSSLLKICMAIDAGGPS